MRMESQNAWTPERLRLSVGRIVRGLARCRSSASARTLLYRAVTAAQYSAAEDRYQNAIYYVVRDCARALRSMFVARAEVLCGFSVASALWRIARRRSMAGVSPAWVADLCHLFDGIVGDVHFQTTLQEQAPTGSTGREAARWRSGELDRLWQQAEHWIRRYPDGLSREARGRRARRRARILAALGGAPKDWQDWRWHCAHVLRTPAIIRQTISLSEAEYEAVVAALDSGVPFGITPYYASLMDDDPEEGRDRAIRAQVLPPLEYVRRMAEARGSRECQFDFMREHDTSPERLITRRYPAIVILKPFNTCPQICVYCQRNWEIEHPMEPDALAPEPVLDRALQWIREHPAVREVLVTGGDPFALEDDQLMAILERIAAIPHVDLIRIGTRVPVTVPMRITPAFARRLGRLRALGRRDIAVVTHVEHPYEITPELVKAVERLRRQGIGVYNQLVYTFYVSRRFEAASLRLLLRRIGIDPYYTFVPKGKEEMAAYRVPLARLLQEQKEEARMLPGLRRTDEGVYNVPGLGKNYVRAVQHRDLLGICPDGSRIYEFHPWEKNVVQRMSYVGRDVPILEYLQRLEAIGEDPAEYESLWYYF